MVHYCQGLWRAQSTATQVMLGAKLKDFQFKPRLDG